MTTEQALTFLRKNQPLPSTAEISEETLREFDEVRAYFAENLDERCVPLLLNSFGQGDGHGVYQLVDGTILKYAPDVVVPVLCSGLRNPLGSVRYWNAQIAASFPHEELVAPLGELLRDGNVDERIAAVTALEAIGGSAARQIMEMARGWGVEKEVDEMIREALKA